MQPTKYQTPLLLLTDCFFFTQLGIAPLPKSIQCTATHDTFDLSPNHTTKLQTMKQVFLLCTERPHSCPRWALPPQRITLCSITALFPGGGGGWLKVTDSVQVTNSLKIHEIPTTSKQINTLFTLKHTNFISPHALLIFVFTHMYTVHLPD